MKRAAIFLAVVWSLAPFLWFAALSLKTPVEILALPPGFWPSGTLENYRSALFGHDLVRALANSALVAAATTAVCVVLGAAAGYALARLPVRGRGWILGAALAATMFPQVAIAGPVWRTLRALGLLDTLPGLVVPHVSLSLPLAVWLLTALFRDLPREIEEAALIDGCGRTGALLRVVAPLAAPALFTTAILVFLQSWNEFFFALLVLSDPSRQTMPLAIALFPGRFTMPWGEIAAAAVVATMPVLAVVLLFQRRIVGGLMAGAVKG